MKKTLTTIVAIAALTFTSHAALAASAKCKVVSVADSTVTLDCGTQAGTFAAGQDVKVKTAKKKAIEGC